MTTSVKTAHAPLTGSHKKMLLALSCAVGLRMLGLFLVLPVFTLYGLEFTRSRLLVGVAFGCYGIAVALTAVPMGRLSDHIGRRKVLLLGMSIFGLGSVLCALPPWFPPAARISILVAGRFVQGLGTITAAAFAAVADQIPEERRSTAMAILGIPVGIAFAVGVIGGPIVAAAFRAQSLFWLTAVLAMLTLGLLARNLEDAPPRQRQVARVSDVLRSKRLLALDAGGFLMNTFMTAFWFYLPLILTQQHHLQLDRFYIVLLPMLLTSGVTMFGFSRSADRGLGPHFAGLAFLIMAVSSVLLFRPETIGLNPAHLAAVIVPGALFFIGFTGLEPILPSLVSKSAHESAYGTALGSFQTLQYLGSFTGGALAGGLSGLSRTAPMAFMTLVGVLGLCVMLLSRAWINQPSSAASTIER
jgi:predicted MFS family arabinose efflux permease